jgi:DnaJ like chaperone protein
MGKYIKWIGGGLGWAFFGPIGGLIGFFAGTLFDSADVKVYSQHSKTRSGDFAMSLLVLVAAVMKADGKVMKSELDYVKTYFVKHYGPVAASEAIMMLRDLLNQQIPVRDVALQIKQHLDYSSRLQLLYFLYGVSGADGKYDKAEIHVIENIADYLGVTGTDKESIRAMFIGTTDAHFKILEVEKTATDDEIKKAYRKMALKYHPDKVNYLGEDVRKSAEEKFKKLTEAYEAIKKERGMN